jgi:hypothetical protein
MDLWIDYCGEIYRPRPGQPFTLGRDADLTLDDNPFLHRAFLGVQDEGGLWWLKNIGSSLCASVVAYGGALQAWLSPGSRLPLVFPHVVVWFTAGGTTYEVEVFQDGAYYEPVNRVSLPRGDTTAGDVVLTCDQRTLIVVLAEEVLRHRHRGAGAIPTSSAAAARLGWSMTKFNRKLDNVCAKLDAMGIRGLHGGPGKLAISRKARLVEYAVGSRLVTADDLPLLDTIAAAAADSVDD